VGKVQVSVTFDLPAFTPTSGRKFVKGSDELYDAVQSLSDLAVGNPGWAFQNFKFVAADYIPAEDEVERYHVEPFGIRHIVRDTVTEEMIFGPENEFKCQKVCELLQAIEDGEYYQEQDGGYVDEQPDDPDSLPF
jgi:hypothetical protein